MYTDVEEEKPKVKKWTTSPHFVSMNCEDPAVAAYRMDKQQGPTI